jgi:SnoaL-like protein
MSEQLDFTAIAQHYIDAWNETDPAARRASIERLWTADASYIDPLVDARGHDAIEATIAGVRARFPDFVFRLAGPVDAHHRQARFGWELGPADGEPPVIGFDVAVADEHGKLTAVLGFLDKVPA